jgi:hypothetical protein
MLSSPLRAGTRGRRRPARSAPPRMAGWRTAWLAVATAGSAGGPSWAGVGMRKIFHDRVSNSGRKSGLLQ